MNRSLPKHYENMTGGINCGGGRRTRLTIVGACSSGAPLIYIGWRGGEDAKGAPQVGGILLGRLLVRPPPFPFRRPGFVVDLRAASGGGGAHQPLCGWCVPPLGP